MPLNFRDLANPPVNIQAHRLKQTKDVFRKWMHYPHDHEVVEMLLGCYAANYLPGVTLWLMLVGPPAAGKSTLVNTLVGLPQSHLASHLTEASILCAGKQDAQSGEVEIGGLLSNLGAFGTILIPEFSGILGAQKISQPQVLSLLRQAYDGHAYRSVGGGENGGLNLAWHGKCAVIAASAEGVDAQRAVIAEMGERFIYYRLTFTDKDDETIMRLIGKNESRKASMQQELRDAVRAVLAPVMANPPAIPLSNEEDERLSILAGFAARCRSVVQRNTSWQQGAEHVHSREQGARIREALGGLLKGLLVIGVEYPRAWDIVKRIAWDTIPIGRAKVLRFLAENTQPGCYYHKGAASIAEALDMPQVPLKRALEDLVLHRVLEQSKQNDRNTEGADKRVKGRWRLAERTWMQYALVEDDPPADPRRGMLGSAVVPEETPIPAKSGI